MKETIVSILRSDTVLPEQFFDTMRRREHLEPEKALLLAILQDAIDSFLKYRGARDKVGKERFQEAKQWILETGNDWIFSFDNVCELLGIDPQFLRRGLLASMEKTLPDGKVRRRKELRRQAA
jgi:hypothetical protein